MRDSFSDVATLARIDLRESPGTYSAAMRRAYWEDRDLAGAMAIAWAGISRLLALAHDSEPAAAVELRSEAKTLAYDMASFTWAGWDEPGIVITPPEARAGHAAAKANLALADELEKDDLPRSRAHWLLGAHELASGLAEQARASFEAAAQLAEGAGPEARAEAGLARAFAALAAMAEGDASEDALARSLAELEAVPDGAVYAGQVRTAREALGIAPAR